MGHDTTGRGACAGDQPASANGWRVARDLAARLVSRLIVHRPAPWSLASDRPVTAAPPPLPARRLTLARHPRHEHPPRSPRVSMLAGDRIRPPGRALSIGHDVSRTRGRQVLAYQSPDIAPMADWSSCSPNGGRDGAERPRSSPGSSRDRPRTWRRSRADLRWRYPRPRPRGRQLILLDRTEPLPSLRASCERNDQSTDEGRRDDTRGEYARSGCPAGA
jgi:hypothetical protein